MKKITYTIEDWQNELSRGRAGEPPPIPDGFFSKHELMEKYELKPSAFQERIDRLVAEGSVESQRFFKRAKDGRVAKHVFYRLIKKGKNEKAN